MSARGPFATSSGGHEAYDAIVVGAGPAGAAAALLLARAGTRVLLLDRAAFPRPKPCGDCLSAGATRVLERLGVLESIRALPHVELAGWRIVAPGGAAFEARFAAAPAAAGIPGALAVERALLDAALLDAAIAAGAVFRHRVRVTDLLMDGPRRVAGVVSGSHAWRARLVIAADGLRSVLAGRLGAVRRPPGLRKVSLTARFLPGTADPTLGEMHLADGLCAGFAAIAPDGRANLTLVADAHRFGRTIAADPGAFADYAIQLSPRLRGRIPDHALRQLPLAASGPFDRPTRRIAFDGAVLVGDAAGYFDPFTGQGIFQALRSAEILAPVALRALHHGTVTARALRPYVREQRRLVSRSRVVQRVIEAALGAPRRADRIIARLARSDRFAASILAVTADLLPPAGLLAPRALLNLFLPPTSARRAAC